MIKRPGSFKFVARRPKRFRFICAVHLFLLRDEQVLLLRRFNTGYEDGNYSVIAGHMDGGEEVVTAMIREAREEAGIEIVPDNMEVVGVMHRNTSPERIDFFLVARAWVNEPRNCEPERCDELAWYPLAHLPENMVPYVRQALENYRSGRWFGEYGWS